ncbi:MAG: hypothetical protein DMG64_17540 [Acidobacteria bacterium]|nr:MAG: hypothetical protein DMG63_13260 [Acidobacteriota bacterium]PYY00155.1 MAG: hypothetical protein DMG64_17540 [Acidobacteriota bacterium]PYY22430.1 MAG: hypothetical protein DMG62_13255 [Acidobacteriota bacterium]
MSESKRIAQLYRSVYEGDSNGEAWHGPALKPLLKDVAAEQASRTPAVGRHSILQLVLHIAYWEEIELRRFQGEVVNAPLNTPDDWPSNRKVGEKEWQSILSRLEASHAALFKAIERGTDEQLSKQVPGRNHDNYTLLHGTIDHCVYHTAQIALLKKG